jgi:hypothetical protein
VIQRDDENSNTTKPLDVRPEAVTGPRPVRHGRDTRHWGRARDVALKRTNRRFSNDWTELHPLGPPSAAPIAARPMAMPQAAWGEALKKRSRPSAGRSRG